MLLLGIIRYRSVHWPLKNIVTSTLRPTCTTWHGRLTERDSCQTSCHDARREDIATAYHGTAWQHQRHIALSPDAYDADLASTLYITMHAEETQKPLDD